MLEGTWVPWLTVCEERYTEIERENRILLEKMTHIMQTAGPGNVNASVTSANGFSNARSNQLYTASAVLPTSHSLQP